MNEQFPIVTARDIENHDDTGSCGVVRKYDAALEQMGGEGAAGRSFRERVLKAAGWDVAVEVSIAAHPERAARCYRIIRAVLMKNVNSMALIDEINFVRAVCDI